METRNELLKMLEEREGVTYTVIPETFINNRNSMCLLKVASCKHFRREGIREGGYIGIDTSLPFKKGYPCAFVKMVKGSPMFRLSRNIIEGYECIGQLSLVVNFPMMEANCGI